MMPQNKPYIDICLLIPVLNEAENINELILRVEKSLFQQNYLLVFIDDGSKDGTDEAILRHQATNKNIILLQRDKKLPGCQRGGALFYGLQNISERYKVIVWAEMDGDLSHQPEEIVGTISELKKGNTDILIVSKYLKHSVTTGRGFFRNFVSLVNSMLFRSTFSAKITDYSNGFRLYNNKAADCILRQRIKYTTPIYLGEVLIHWLKADLTIKEIPGKYIGRKKGNSQVVLKDVFEGLAGYFYLISVYYAKAR